MTPLTVCPTCNGTGECFSNPSAPDPRGETSETCPTCMGTGRPPAYSDAQHYDAMRDEQAIHFGEVPEDTDFAFHRQPTGGTHEDRRGAQGVLRVRSARPQAHDGGAEEPRQGGARGTGGDVRDRTGRGAGHRQGGVDLTNVQPPSRLAIPGTRPVDDPQAPPNHLLPDPVGGPRGYLYAA